MKERYPWIEDPFEELLENNESEFMHLGIIDRAIEEARSSDYHPYKMGAVIFKGPRILSSGHNEIRGNGRIHPKYKYFDNTIHAEQSAVLSLKDWGKAKNSDILIVRINNSGKFSLAYPCPMCQSFLKFLGINKVYFSDREGNISCIKCRDLVEGDYENSWKLEGK